MKEIKLKPKYINGKFYYKIGNKYKKYTSKMNDYIIKYDQEGKWIILTILHNKEILFIDNFDLLFNSLIEKIKNNPFNDEIFSLLLLIPKNIKKIFNKDKVDKIIDYIKNVNDPDNNKAKIINDFFYRYNDKIENIYYKYSLLSCLIEIDKNYSFSYDILSFFLINNIIKFNIYLKFLIKFLTVCNNGFYSYRLFFLIKDYYIEKTIIKKMLKIINNKINLFPNDEYFIKLKELLIKKN